MDDRLLDQSIDSRVARLQVDLGNLVQVLIEGLSEQLAPYGIDAVEYTVLCVCAAAGPITLKDLRERVPVDYGHLSRVTSRLQDRDLLEKRRPQGDRRLVRVEVTEEGMSLVPELTGRTGEYYALLLRGIGEEELPGHIAVMEKMIIGGGGYE